MTVHWLYLLCSVVVQCIRYYNLLYCVVIDVYSSLSDIDDSVLCRNRLSLSLHSFSLWYDDFCVYVLCSGLSVAQWRDSVAILSGWLSRGSKWLCVFSSMPLCVSLVCSGHYSVTVCILYYLSLFSLIIVCLFIWYSIHCIVYSVLWLFLSYWNDINLNAVYLFQCQCVYSILYFNVLAPLLLFYSFSQYCIDSI
jgi:hypothetical protein